MKMIENVRQEAEKRPNWVLRFFLLYLSFIVVYCLYLYVFMDVRITIKPDIQKEYGKYLVEMQDKMVGQTLDFANLVEDINRQYTDREKDRIKDELVKQNELLKELQINSPDEINNDYMNIYKDMVKIFSFYIQGETMQSEYIYAYKDEYIADEKMSDENTRIETYTLGSSLCEVMGNMMLNNYDYINNVRGTDYQSSYTIVPVDDISDYLWDAAEDSADDKDTGNNKENISPVLTEKDKSDINKLLQRTPISDNK